MPTLAATAPHPSLPGEISPPRRPGGLARDFLAAAAIWLPLLFAKLNALAWNARNLDGEMGAPLWPEAVKSAADFGVMIVVTPLIFRACERWPLAGRRARRRHLGVHAGIYLLLIPCSGLIQVAIVSPVMGSGPELGGYAAFIITGTSYLYPVAAGIGTAMHLRREVREERLRTRMLANELAQLELGDLHGRLRPELFFRTLEAIERLIPRDAAAADRLVARLGVFLRHSLDAGDWPETGVEEEMAAMAAFLEVMAIPCGGAVTASVSADPGALGAAVPPLLLQPLLAEVFRHPPGPGAQVRVRAAAEGERLRLHLLARGFALPPGAADAAVRDARRRLRHLYGPDAQLTSKPLPDGGVEVDVLVPAGGAAAAPVPTLHHATVP